jgi:uncharacterized protein involved in exopolysaccharide biosynthesis
MTDHLTQRGYAAEVARHRNNLARALNEAHRSANSLSARLGSDEPQLAGEARQLLAYAGDVAQAAAALEAATQLSFTVDA